MRDMKKRMWALIFVILGSSYSYGVADMDISGEFNGTFQMGILPTSDRGQSSFLMPSLFVDFEAPLQEGNLLRLTLEGSEQGSSTVDSRFLMRVREAYVNIVHPFVGNQFLRLGLIPQIWQESQYEDVSYRFLGTEAWAITEKWGYLNYSDLGLTYFSEDYDGRYQWALSFSNGEGVREKETGPHKDAALFAQVNLCDVWKVSMNWVYGSYEKYGTQGSRKERQQMLVSYQPSELFQFGLELLRAEDPADAVQDYKMAESVDASGFLGQDVIAEGGSLFAVMGVGSSSEALLRYDYLNAVTSAKEKDLRTAMIAYVYRWTDDMKLALAFDQTQYGSQFRAGVRDRSKVEVATQIFF